MKSAPFSYHAPATTAAALGLKSDQGGDARVLAGGQSLMPLMHFRLATPAALIDINGIDELDFIERKNGTLSIGARTRQAALLQSDVAAETVPLLVEAVSHAGHAQIRNRGTVAGSAAHADPSAEIPAALMALGAEMVCSSGSGSRTVAAGEFFTGPFDTALADEEILTELRVPAWPSGTGSAWMELTRLYNGFPVVGAGALIHLDNGTIDRAAIGLCGLAATPLISDAAAQTLMGNAPSVELVEDAASAAVADLEPPGDVHGSTAYRKRAGRAYVKRVLTAAINHAGGQQ